jgi:hypothetical protein
VPQVNKEPCDGSKQIHALAVREDGASYTVHVAAQQEQVCSVMQWTVSGGNMVQKMKVACPNMSQVQRIAVSPGGQFVYVAGRHSTRGNVVLKINTASKDVRWRKPFAASYACTDLLADGQVLPLDELEGSAFMQSGATALGGVRRLGKGIAMVRDGKCVWRSVALTLSCRRLDMDLESVKADDAVLRVLQQRAGSTKHARTSTTGDSSSPEQQTQGRGRSSTTAHLKFTGRSAPKAHAGTE